MADQIGFVDSITTEPAERLSLSNGAMTVLRDGTDLSPAPLRRAESSGFLEHGSRTSAAAYGDRVLQLHLQVLGEDDDEIATQIQALVQQLDQPNILRWHPATATHPVFMRTKRCSIEGLEEILSTHRRAIVPIPAEPFGLGLPITLGPTLVSNDPSAGCYVDIPFPDGDLDTPVRLTVLGADVIAAGGRESVIAMRRRGTPGNAPSWLPASSMTPSAGSGSTTFPGHDAAMAGAGNNYAHLTGLPDDEFETRLTALHPAVPSLDAPGKYRTWFRLRRANGSDELRVRLAVSPDGVTELLPDPTGVVLPAGTVMRWCDVGVFQNPIGDDPRVDSMTGLFLPSGGVQLRVQAARTTGTTSNLDINGVMTLPADDRLGQVAWPSVAGPTQLVLDSVRGPKLYALGASGETLGISRGLSGGMPLISPLAYNRLWWLLDGGLKSTAGDDLLETFTAWVTYQPRYAYLRPPTG